MKKFFVFDVESIGLHGEAYAVGGGLFLENGTNIWKFRFGVDPKRCQGTEDDRRWVENNAPDVPVTHSTPTEMRFAFWGLWELAKAAGATMAADCLWPVEAGFVIQCVKDDPIERKWEGPYPFLEISTVLFVAGLNPLGKFRRNADEEPIHDPLADALQSARLLCESLAKLKGGVA